MSPSQDCHAYAVMALYMAFPMRLLFRLTAFVRCVALLVVVLVAASPALAAKTYTDNGDGTVTDPATGLTWMRCSMGQTWAGNTCTGTAARYDWDKANALTGKVTFADKSDWRLPNIRELQTLADRTVTFPAIDIATFPATPGYQSWSESPHSSSPTMAWTVNFLYGDTFDSLKSNPHYVRLVRSGQPFGLLDIARPSTDYVDHDDGTVTHSPTGLMWQRCAVGQAWTGSTCEGAVSDVTWDDAKRLTISLAGKTDWRLPTVDELLSLVDYRRSLPAMNTALFPSLPYSEFWSGSSRGSYALTVDFYNGSTGTFAGDITFLVRLVRTSLALGPVTLTIFKTGNGTVTSTPAGISCGSTCSASFASGTSVTLTATPASGTTFSGGCSGTGSCTVSMTAAQSVTATFAAAVPGAPTNVSAIAGNTLARVSFTAPSTSGNSPITSYTVTSTPSGITATGTAPPIPVTGLVNGVSYTFKVTATSAAGTSQASSASNPVTPTPPFEANPVLLVQAAGSGSGTITARGTLDGAPINLNCKITATITSGICSVTLTNGAAITLTAVSALGTRLSNWSGGCTAVGSTCNLRMDESKTVTAVFAPVGACDTSEVASITPNGYAFVNGHQAFEVTCQNGRYGGVRLPRGNNVNEMRVCAFQQSSCGNDASVCRQTAPDPVELEAVYGKRNQGTNVLLADPVIRPFATWVCK